MTNINLRPDAATGKTTAKREALKAKLMDYKKKWSAPSDLVGLLPAMNVYMMPFGDEPFYGISAVEANEVCEEILGLGKYDLYETDGRFAGALLKF